jgi:dihydropteroate synthase
MGILNATPDSFSDGGRFHAKDDALRHAEAMIAAGVDLIDIGGESTKPGAIPVSLQEELDRVLPIIESLKDCGVALSIDTYKAETMRQALNAGVDCINDIWALRQAGAEQVVIDSALARNCGIVLMHMQCDPVTMQLNPNYENVVSEVNAFLMERATRLIEQGIAVERIAIDPGFGFGKNLDHNLDMLQNFIQFTRQQSNTVVYQLGLTTGIDNPAVNPASFAFDAAAGTLTYVMPVPEPGQYAMLLAGIAAIGFMVRRRQSQV